MLMQMTDILGFDVKTKGKKIGIVKDLLFDLPEKKMKFFDVESSDWFKKKTRMLFDTDRFYEVIWSQEELDLSVTSEEVKNAPGLMDHPTASRDPLRQIETFKWSQYSSRFSFQELLPLEGKEKFDVTYPEMIQESLFSNNLYSLYETIGFEINAQNERFGSVKDVIINPETNTVQYLSLFARRWFPGNTHFVPWELVNDIHLSSGEVMISSSMEQIKKSPSLNASKFIHRQTEKSVYEHYNLTPYWTDTQLAKEKRPTG